MREKVEKKGNVTVLLTELGFITRLFHLALTTYSTGVTDLSHATVNRHHLQSQARELNVTSGQNTVIFDLMRP